MIAAAAFVIGFALIGLSVVLVAMRGGPRGAREAMHSQTARGRSTATWVIAGFSLLFGVGIPAAVMAANADHDRQSRGGVHLTSEQAQGRRIFAATCGTCHTLSSAKTTGRVGPNLDQIRPPKALVLDAIAKGRARGQGQMPALLLVGDEAQKVASYVSTVAGR